MRNYNTRPLPYDMPFTEYDFNTVAESIGDMLDIAIANPDPAIFYSLSLHIERLIITLENMRARNPSLTLRSMMKESYLSRINGIPESEDPN